MRQRMMLEEILSIKNKKAIVITINKGNINHRSSISNMNVKADVVMFNSAKLRKTITK